jgi:hypothetical protein
MMYDVDCFLFYNIFWCDGTVSSPHHHPYLTAQKEVVVGIPSKAAVDTYITLVVLSIDSFALVTTIVIILLMMSNWAVT